MPDIPPPSVKITCGVCNDDLEHDGDAYRCADCRISYTSTESSGDYTDPEEAPCGAAYPYENPLTNTHAFRTTRDEQGRIVVTQWRTTIREVGPCHLPASHAAGMHDYPATGRHEYHDENPRKD